MSPVCPACRAPVRLEAFACGRCGLAIRPTCASCGEPLMVGMTSCWFCREPIEPNEDVADEVAPVVRTEPAPVVQQLAVARPATPVQVVERTVRPSEPVFPPRRRLSAGRALLLWMMLAVLLTLVLLFVEMGLPRLPAESPRAVELTSRAFPDVGFSLSYPEDWRVTESTKRVSFFAEQAEGGKPTRGLRVVRTDVDFKDVDDQAEETNRRRVLDYMAVSSEKDTLDGRDALVFVFSGNDLLFEQWWVDLPKRRTLRLEFWSRLFDDDASQTNERIARTLRVL